MESFTLSIEYSAGTWFGCLIDSGDRLVAASFGDDPKGIRKHLAGYSRKSSGRSPRIERHLRTRDMIRLFEGEKPSQHVIFNDDLTTPFQRRVIRVLTRIPTGKVTTYGLIAEHIDSAPRAVGGAVGSNPWPLFVPCHRVVNANLTIGNYSMCGKLGESGTLAKKSLLNRERVPILGEKIDRRALWVPAGKKG